MTHEKRQPEWVPDAVWTAYQVCAKYYVWAESKKAWVESNDLHIPQRQDLEIFQKAVLDKKCARVWDIIFKSKGDPSFFAVDESQFMPCQLFVWTLRNALAGPPASSLMPAKERKDRGEKIAKLARQLSRELQFVAPNGDIPPALTGPLSVHLVKVYESYIDPELDEIELAMREYDEGPDLSTRVVSELFFKGHKSILGLLAQCAEEWAETTSAEYRNDPIKARRNYFIREMTDYFNVNSGRPHREMVARLLECFLGEVVTALDVTRIAPVR